VQSRHAGIKACSSGNEKREEKPRLTLKRFWKSESMGRDMGEKAIVNMSY
jgi:hypothetical protein